MRTAKTRARPSLPTLHLRIQKWGVQEIGIKQRSGKNLLLLAGQPNRPPRKKANGYSGVLETARESYFLTDRYKIVCGRLDVQGEPEQARGD